MENFYPAVYGLKISFWGVDIRLENKFRRRVILKRIHVVWYQRWISLTKNMLLYNLRRKDDRHIHSRSPKGYNKICVLRYVVISMSLVRGLAPSRTGFCVSFYDDDRSSFLLRFYEIMFFEVKQKLGIRYI
jgi:hypothetical protein